MWVRKRRRSEAANRGTEALGGAQPRSRARSPGETPAGDDCQKTCSMQFWRRLPKNLFKAAEATTAKKLVLVLVIGKQPRARDRVNTCPRARNEPCAPGAAG